jgi:hypothetical protein
MSRRNRSASNYPRRGRSRNRKSPRATHKESMAAMRRWFLPDGGIFANLKFHGNTTWSPESMVWLALSWAWSECRNLTDAFKEAVECSQTISESSPLSTYQGFMGAMVRWTVPFMELLCALLHQRMEEIGDAFWRVGTWVPIAFDGSRSTAPRTAANVKALCAANYGKGKTARYRRKKSKGMRRKLNERNKSQPQEPKAWIKMLWHMRLRLPWMWRLGPSNSSERTHVMDMVTAGRFPKSTLLCGDAGFVGYPLWSHIVQSGADFLVRVGANVSLLTEHVDYCRQKNGIVFCWPKSTSQAGQPPLVLRLVKVRLGKTKVWLVTNVLDSAKLTNKQMISLYKMRWGVEIEFRGLKQTLDRSRLRCRNDQRLLAELSWSIMAMAVAEIFALREQLADRRSGAAEASQPIDPVKRSLANAMRAIRHCMRHLKEVPSAGQDLQSMLRLAVTDSYERKARKGARYRPPNPDKKPLGDPKLRTMTAEERSKLDQLEKKIAA